jgi:phosphoribosylamine--glycine ligase
MKNGKIQSAPMHLTSGDYVLVTTGTGDSVRQARDAAYRVMKRLKVPSSPFWRPDIGMRLKKQIPALQAMGYATGMTF